MTDSWMDGVLEEARNNLLQNWFDIRVNEERARRAADDKKAADELRDAALRVVDQAARYRLFRAGKISRWAALGVDAKQYAVLSVGAGLLFALCVLLFPSQGIYDIDTFVVTAMGLIVAGLGLLYLRVVDINDRQRYLVTRAIYQKVIGASADSAAAVE